MSGIIDIGDEILIKAKVVDMDSSRGEIEIVVGNRRLWIAPSKNEVLGLVM